MNIKKRIFALLMAACMIAGMLPVSAFAADCEHHTSHTAECGYVEAVAGAACTHQCGADCVTTETNCIHGENHDEACGYMAATEDAEEVPCGHSCGDTCKTQVKNCIHGEHDDACGYKAAVEGAACTFVCSTCAANAASEDDGDDEEGSEAVTVCTGSETCAFTGTHNEGCPKASGGEDGGEDGGENTPTSCTEDEKCTLAEGHEGDCNVPVTCDGTAECKASEHGAECAKGKADAAAAEAAKQAEEAAKQAEEASAARIQAIQTLINALPETVTADTRAEVESQLAAISEAQLTLTEEERLKLDVARFNTVVAAINELDGQPGASDPEVATDPVVTNATAAAHPNHEANEYDSVIFGELKVTNNVPIQSMKIELYAGEDNKIADTVVQNVDFSGNNVYTLTWHIDLKQNECTDNCWKTTWKDESHPRIDQVPTHIITYVNDVNVGRTNVTFNYDGGAVVTSWAEMPGVNVAKAGNTYYESLQEAINGANGAEITLLGDITENNITVADGKTADINLNGKTVNGYFMVYGTATIKGGNIISTGIIVNGDTVSAIENNGASSNLTVRDLNITSGRHAIRVDGGTAVINGGSYTAADAASVHAVNISTDATVTIKDGTFVGNNKSGTGAVALRDASSLTIEKGTFTGGSQGSLTVWGNGGTATVKNGTFESVYGDVAITIENGTFETVNKLVGRTVSGGTFGSDPSENVVSTKAAKLVDGKYTIVDAVAAIDQQGYATLKEAVEAAEADAEVTLLENTEGDGIVIDKSITIDFDEHSYTVTGALVGSPGTESQAFQLLKDNDVTFKNGTIVANTAAMVIQNYSDLTLTGMNVSGSSASYVVSNNNGNVKFTGGTVITASSNAVAFDVCRFANYNGATVEVDGATINGTIEVADDAGYTGNAKSILTLTSGAFNGDLVITTELGAASVTKSENATLAAPEGYEWDKNTTLVLKEITLTFDPNGGKIGDDSAAQVITQNFGTTFTAPDDLTREGYTFAGWDKEVPAKMPAEDQTFTAQWTANTYKIKFNSNTAVFGGSMDDQTVTYGTSTPLSANTYVRQGYTFLGWATTADGDVVYQDQASVLNLTAEAGATVTLYAKWSVNQYTLTFDANGGYFGRDDDIEEIKQDFGTAVQVPTATLDGFTLKEWKNEAGESVTITTMPAENMTLYAQWEENSYTIKFDLGGYTGAGAEKFADMTVKYTDIVTLPMVTFKNNGKNFAGWATAADGNVIFANGDQDTMLAEDGEITLYAVWTDKNVFTVDTTKQSYTYDGKAQEFKIKGLPAGATAELEYVSADGDILDNPKNVGTYTVLVRIEDLPDDYYAFPFQVIYDGLVVEKATLTATYQSETIKRNEVPELKVVVTGFVNGETAASLAKAGEYKAPYVVASYKYSKNELTPQGGEAKNYKFKYVSGILTIRTPYESTPDKLLQTGAQTMPLVLMAIAGISALAAGMWVMRKKSYER